MPIISILFVHILPVAEFSSVWSDKIRECLTWQSPGGQPLTPDIVTWYQVQVQVLVTWHIGTYGHFVTTKEDVAVMEEWNLVWNLDRKETLDF